ncbi:hypothetical protein [Streptomyces stelliscabiei]|uniref:Anti-sigma factor antagonist n=1 Tax=Streptomyces stelliscabiei TaxID=146820 RepID=A0A8I0PES8_9ACTN|nr:hypothetical protein [Streptomyces stelliscabiei]
MHFTLRIDGTAAHITVHGEIDYTTLPTLRAATAGLPREVTEPVRDLHDARFTDVAGLHRQARTGSANQAVAAASPHLDAAPSRAAPRPRSSRRAGLGAAVACCTTTRLAKRSS